MQLLKIRYLITEKNFSQNNCESNVLNIYITCSLGSKELILKRASSESKIVEKTLRAGCGSQTGKGEVQKWMDLINLFSEM